MLQSARIDFDPKRLSPFMSEAAFAQHYDGHYAADLKAVNEAILGLPLEREPLTVIIAHARLHQRPRLYRHASQAWNHGFFFASIAKTPNLAPSGDLAAAIVDRFDDFETLKKALHR